MDKFKLVIILGYFALGVAAFILVGMVTVFAADQLDRTTNFVMLMMGVASTGAVTFYMLGSQSKKLEEVKVQTNGANTALRETIANKDEQISSLQQQLLAVVGNAPPVAGA